MGKAAEIFQGVFAPITTPFTDDDALSLDNLERNIQMWLISPLNGFVVLGTTGEAAHLTHQEKLQVIAATVRAAEERPVIAGTGANSTAETIALTEAAAGLGVAAVMVVTPYFFGSGLGAEQLSEHYEAVADASPVPVFLYNIPPFTGVNIAPDLVAELSHHPNIVGIKDSCGNLRQLGEIIEKVPADFAVFTGAPELLLPALSLGARGAILGIANAAPWECCEVYELFHAGKFEEAAALQKRLNVVAGAVEQFGIGGLKALLQMLGYYGGNPRRPLRPADITDLDQIRAALREVRMLGC